MRVVARFELGPDLANVGWKNISVRKVEVRREIDQIEKVFLRFFCVDYEFVLERCVSRMGGAAARHKELIVASASTDNP
jgi:hypothetical protein